MLKRLLLALLALGLVAPGHAADKKYGERPTIMVDTQTAIFLDAGMTEGLDNDIEGWDVGAGIKAMW